MSQGGVDRGGAAALLALVAGGLLQISQPIHAAEAGAWETFFSQANANGWAVFDYGVEEPDDPIFLPFWNSDVIGGEYIFFQHTGNSALEFFTDDFGNAGEGKMIGDYAAENIQAILCEVYIDSLADLDFIDCSIYGMGPEGEGYYYGPIYDSDDFAQSGWQPDPLRFPFDGQWEFDNGEEFIPVEITEELLSNIEEVGIRFFLNDDAIDGNLSGVDDIKLEPLIVAPVLDQSISGGDFKLGFTPPDNLYCWIEEWQPSETPEWATVVGEDYIVGPEPYEFSSPISTTSSFFRVQSEGDYIPFETPPAEEAPPAGP